MATSSTTMPAGVGSEEKKVIFASSLGTVFEWYDFYLYAVLAPFFAALFFPPGNQTAALLSAFATYAAGFLVRPFGALVFGRIGDLVGRKYTFLVTILFMGFSTFAVGLLPTYEAIGWAAPVLLVLLPLGATVGQGVVWYTGQFYALFFLTITLKMDGQTAYTMIALSLLLGTPFFIVFGALSDKIGRLKIILAGCLIAALTYFPLFQALTHYVNPALETFAKANPITVQAKDCNFHIFVGPWSKFSDCDRAKDYLTKAGLSFTSSDLPATSTDNVVVKVGPT